MVNISYFLASFLLSALVVLLFYLLFPITVLSPATTRLPAGSTLTTDTGETITKSTNEWSSGKGVLIAFIYVLVSA